MEIIISSMQNSHFITQSEFDDEIIVEMNPLHCFQKPFLSSVPEDPDHHPFAFSLTPSAARFAPLPAFAPSSAAKDAVFFAIFQKYSTVLNKIKMCLS